VVGTEHGPAPVVGLLEHRDRVLGVARRVQGEGLGVPGDQVLDVRLEVCGVTAALPRPPRHDITPRGTFAENYRRPLTAGMACELFVR
jgi:hypothetical protein